MGIICLFILILRSKALERVSYIARVVSASGLSLSEVLSTFPSPTIDLVMPCTVPLKVGLANGALLLSAPCVALGMGLLVSAVLSTLPWPTIDLLMQFIAIVNDTGPLSNTRPLIVVVPDRTAFDESAFLFANHRHYFNRANPCHQSIC